MSLKHLSRLSLEIGFSLLILSFFFTLGSDLHSQLKVRFVFGGALFLVFLLLKGGPAYRIPTGRLTIFSFAIFLAYQVIRGIWAWVGFHAHWINAYSVHYERYLLAPLGWAFGLGILILSYSLYFDRASVHRFFYLLAWTCVGLAACAIPPLMQKGVPLYDAHGIENYGYFPEFIYFKPWIEKYIAARSAHVNYTGDVIAIGVLAALGVAIYGIQIFREAVAELRERYISSTPWRLASYFLLPLALACVSMTAIFLLNSRGTILCMMIALICFMVLILIRFHSKLEIRFVVAAIILSGCFAFWAGNMPKVWKELMTLSQEHRENASFATNREGARRSIAMFKSYPLMGVGTLGYKEFSEKYATVKMEGFDFARYQSMSHYLQLLAEEGLGAFLYYLFLLCYGYEVITRLFRTQSRFQYIMAAALFSVVIMVFSHAAFNHLMQRVSMSVLIYACMGASLSILREDFD